MLLKDCVLVEARQHRISRDPILFCRARRTNEGERDAEGL